MQDSQPGTQACFGSPMHTQTASASELRAGIASRLHAAAGLGFYLLTLAGEVVLGAGVRWLLTYLGAVALGAFVPLGPGAEQLALLAALLPLAWSLLGLLLPGRGLVWTRRIGARRPSAEEAGLIDDALRLLRAVEPGIPEARAVYLLDDPIPAGAARGRSVVLSRGLLESDSVTPVLAHELGHTTTLDGRLTEALARLELWGGSPRPADPRSEAAGLSYLRCRIAAATLVVRSGPQHTGRVRERAAARRGRASPATPTAPAAWLPVLSPPRVSATPPGDDREARQARFARRP